MEKMSSWSWIPRKINGKYLIIPGAVLLLAIVLLSGIALVRSFRTTGRSPADQQMLYADREILIPGARYLLPDTEELLLNPDFQFVADPSRPLDRDLLERLEVDLFQSVREELEARLEKDVEGLLFD